MNLVYTKEQDEWLANNYPCLGPSHAVDIFNELFNSNKSMEALKARAYRLGLHINDELKTKIYKSNTRFVSYKLGEIIEEKDGYLYIKVQSTGKRYERWRPLGRYIYEQKYGALPKNYSVIFLDSNPKNCSLDNLIAIPNKYKILLERKNLRSEFPEITLSGIKWVELYDALIKSGFDFKEAERKVSNEDAYEHKMFTTNTSGYTGVSYRKDRNNYRAFITIGDKTIHLGTFKTAEAAYKARLDAEKRYSHKHTKTKCSQNKHEL